MAAPILFISGMLIVFSTSGGVRRVKSTVTMLESIENIQLKSIKKKKNDTSRLSLWELMRGDIVS